MVNDVGEPLFSSLAPSLANFFKTLSILNFALAGQLTEYSSLLIKWE